MDESKFQNAPKVIEAPPTLILTRAHVSGLMTADDYFAAAEEAFRAHATGGAVAPPPMHISVEGGSFHAKGARLQGVGGKDYVAVKVNGNFPSNPKSNGLPTIQGALILSDATNGAVLAVMDSIEITLRRTAAATALAATYLARPNATTLAICGCGEQSRAQLGAIANEFQLREVFAWDIDARAAALFAADASAYLGFAVEPVTELRDATRASDIIVTCTTAKTPFLDRGDVRPGTFIAAVGADSPHKSEIAPTLMATARVIVDVREQCEVMGDLHHAINAGLMTARNVHASLGELVLAQRPARESNDEISVFDSTGTAIQDVAAAARVYERAKASHVGTVQTFNR